MENHPIPQDVTGFQFKLIGDMTVKQFAYVAAGVVLAWLFYSLHISFLIKYPLILAAGGLGAALAFLPVEGRPLDTMMINFVRALFTPNQYIFQKTGGQFTTLPLHVVSPKTQLPAQQPTAAAPQNTAKLNAYLQNIHPTAQSPLDQKESSQLTSVSSMFSGSFTPSPAPAPTTAHVVSMVSDTPPAAPRPVPPPPAPVQQPQPEQQQEAQIEQEASALSQQLASAKAAEEVAKNTPNEQSAHEKVKELESKLTDMMTQKQQLEAQLLKLQKMMSMQGQQVYSPSQPQQKAETPNVRKVTPAQAVSIGLPTTPDVPNLVTGVVKDPRGNVLPNILVEIKDPEGNPIRAFKTNGLGQFASATPLPNGTFTMILEDPKSANKFDAIELIAKGEIMHPLEIISVDAREELRKSLFG